MISAVATIYNEEDIIVHTLAHLYANGIDHIYIVDASTDGTRSKYWQFRDRITVIVDMDDYHRQPYWITRLSRIAHSEGADWVIPFDADEFWYAEDETIAEFFTHIPEHISTIHASTWVHTDWEHHLPEPQPWGKWAFRPTEKVSVANGNHSVEDQAPGDIIIGGLYIREIQFRSLEHLARKSAERVARLDPSLPYSEGTHQRDLHAGGPLHQAAYWSAVTESAVYDPIPYRGGLPR